MDLVEDIIEFYVYDSYFDDLKVSFYRKFVGLRRVIKYVEKEEEGSKFFLEIN